MRGRPGFLYSHPFHIISEITLLRRFRLPFKCLKTKHLRRHFFPLITNPGHAEIKPAFSPVFRIPAQDQVAVVLITMEQEAVAHEPLIFLSQDHKISWRNGQKHPFIPKRMDLRVHLL